MKVSDQMSLKLLDELIRAWLATMSPEEVVADVRKIRLLKEARAAIPEGEPSELVRTFYQEIFLRDLWNGESGQPTQESA